jgi:hypothetical protein
MRENNRYLNVFRSLYHGVTSPADEHFKKIIDTQLCMTECSKYNPQPEDILPEIVKVIDSHPNTKMSRLKADLGVSRADIMTLYVSFTDHHKIDCVGIIKPHIINTGFLIEEIKEQFNKTGAPLGISEQLEISLNLASHDISKAVLALSLATRMVARNLDSRLMDIKLTDEEIFAWKHIFAPFGFGKGFEDTSGDTYHFWFGIMAGISREEKSESGILNNTKQLICDLTYPYTSMASDILRHKIYLGINSWNTHDMVDKIGYHTGRALANIYESHNDIDTVPNLA